MERLGDRAGVRLVGVRGFAFTARRWARAGLSAFDDVQDRSSAAMAHALRSRRGGGGARPAVVPPFRLPAAGHGDARSRLDLRFRQTIDKLGLSAALLAEVNRQPDARGLVIKRGTLVDATLITAQ
jgi:hypothetical protein